MKKFMLIILLFCSTAFGLNLATFWTDTTLNSSALDADGALVQSPLFDKDEIDNGNITPTTAMDANGGPVASNTGVALSVTAGVGTLSDTSAFGDVIIGMYVNVFASDDLTDVPLASYRVDAIPNISTLTLEGVSAGGSGTGSLGGDGAPNVSYRIGGSLAAMDDTTGLQAAFDRVGNQAGADSSVPDNNLDILVNQNAALTLTATIDIDAISGSTSTRVRVIGTNSAFVNDGTMVTLTASSDIDRLLEFFLESDSTYWYNIELDGNSVVTTCLYNNEDGSDNHVFIDCDFHHSTGNIFSVRGLQIWRLYNCELHHSVSARGWIPRLTNRARLLMRGGAVYNNGTDGMSLEDTSDIKGVLIYGNASYGIQLSSFADSTTIENCTIFNNLAGIQLPNNSDFGYSITGNTLVNNDTYGIEFQNKDASRVRVFDWNHYDGNGTAPVDLVGGFSALPGFSDIQGDPLFTDAAGGNFIPTSSSPLIDAGVGVGGTSDTIGALCATAGGGGSTGGVVGVSWN